MRNETVIVKYRDRDGYTVQGKVIDALTSTSGVDFVCINNFVNRVPVAQIEAV